MKMTVLVDNIGAEELPGEWGLSLYIEHNGLRWLLDAARSRGYRMAVSVVFTRNEGSTALMRKFGFTRFGVLPGGVVNDGVALDVAYWYKNLV